VRVIYADKKQEQINIEGYAATSSSAVDVDTVREDVTNTATNVLNGLSPCIRGYRML
jgi:hypothetical protein